MSSLLKYLCKSWKLAHFVKNAACPNVIFFYYLEVTVQRLDRTASGPGQRSAYQ